MSMTIVDILSARGFHVEGTGGGCEAFLRQSDDSYQMITDDLSLPESLDAICQVGTYAGQWADDDHATGESCMSMVEMRLYAFLDRGGVPLYQSMAAVSRIHSMLDGEEWDCETIEHVAAVVESCGYVIRDCNELEDE